jgi:hypothetical protein
VNEAEDELRHCRIEKQLLIMLFSFLTF